MAVEEGLVGLEVGLVAVTMVGDVVGLAAEKVQGEDAVEERSVAVGWDSVVVVVGKRLDLVAGTVGLEAEVDFHT